MIGVDFYACKANTVNKDHPEMAFTTDLTICGYKKKTKEIQQESKLPSVNNVRILRVH